MRAAGKHRHPPASQSSWPTWCPRLQFEPELERSFTASRRRVQRNVVCATAGFVIALDLYVLLVPGSIGQDPWSPVIPILSIVFAVVDVLCSVWMRLPYELVEKVYLGSILFCIVSLPSWLDYRIFSENKSLLKPAFDDAKRAQDGMYLLQNLLGSQLWMTQIMAVVVVHTGCLIRCKWSWLAPSTPSRGSTPRLAPALLLTARAGPGCRRSRLLCLDGGLPRLLLRWYRLLHHQPVRRRGRTRRRRRRAAAP